VTHAEIRQLSAPQFKEVCVELAKEAPNAMWRWYFAGPEKGSADFFRPGVDLGVNLKELPARADKFTRAIACTAAWNRGHVLVPIKAPWLDRFISEIAGFTGVADAHDDVVDALVAAFDELATSAPQGVSVDVVTADRQSVSARTIPRPRL
jgi:predicted phage terminase large subunit-like protein